MDFCDTPSALTTSLKQYRPHISFITILLFKNPPNHYVCKERAGMVSFSPIQEGNMETGKLNLAELFVSRANAVAAKVSQVADAASAQKLVTEEIERLGSENTGVAYAALGIANTGTCVVETDDESTRLSTMLPETSIIVLNAADIVYGILDIAPYLRQRQKDGKISYTSLITGPSRTADIERVGAIGVHGPLSVHIILVEA